MRNASRICLNSRKVAKFLCGDADCRTSAIQAAYPSPRLFLRKSRGLSHSAASPSPGRTGAPRFPSCTGSQGRPPSVIARSEATGQSVLLRQGIAESSTLGEYERGCGFARSRASLPGFSAGKRIATPVCALVRNDMQKAGTCARVQGRGARKVCRRQGVSTGARTSPTVIARSEATWQSVLLAAGHSGE